MKTSFSLRSKSSIDFHRFVRKPCVLQGKRAPSMSSHSSPFLHFSIFSGKTAVFAIRMTLFLKNMDSTRIVCNFSPLLLLRRVQSDLALRSHASAILRSSLALAPSPKPFWLKLLSPSVSSTRAASFLKCGLDHPLAFNHSRGQQLQNRLRHSRAVNSALSKPLKLTQKE